MSGNPIRTIGILGAGRVGTALARQALKAGYEVLVATARPPAEIELLVEVMAPGAKAVTADAAARASDLVILAVPLAKYRKLDPESLSGKIAIDVMNYWAPTDGTLAEFEGHVSSSEVVQEYLRHTRLVRTLNHIGYHEVEEDALPSGHPERRALAVAGNDAQARAAVAEFLDRLGYDAVDAGMLASARTFAIGTPIFEGHWQRDEMRRLLDAAAERPLVSLVS
jgi:8-hydroxy-5-deazaflavin:NADPH oxidoreductase